MELFTGGLKLKAAVRSLPQFYPVVRSLFPNGAEVDEAVIETATVYLYVKLAREVFSRRFVSQLKRRLAEQLRTGDAEEIGRRIGILMRRTETLEEAASRTPGDASQTDFQRHVTCMIRSLFIEANIADFDDELVTATFTRFEDVVRRIKSHLSGIKQQNQFVLK